MTVGQQRAWDEQWAHLGNDVTALPEGPVDFAGWFDRDAPVLLEIGSGMGETTSVLAANEPEVNYLAVEVYEPGLARTARNAAEAGVDNLRLVEANAPEVLAALPEASVDELWVFFPDPWRKARHTKRRLVDAGFCRQAARVLRSGGSLRLATDWASYADQMRDVVAADPDLVNPHAATSGWAPRFDGRVRTGFERKGAAVGRIIRDVLAVRRDRVA